MSTPEQPTLPGFEPTVLELAQRAALALDRAAVEFERRYGRLQTLQDDEDAAACLLDYANRN